MWRKWWLLRICKLIPPLERVGNACASRKKKKVKKDGPIPDGSVAVLQADSNNANNGRSTDHSFCLSLSFWLLLCVNKIVPSFFFFFFFFFSRLTKILSLFFFFFALIKFCHPLMVCFQSHFFFFLFLFPGKRKKKVKNRRKKRGYSISTMSLFFIYFFH